MKRLAAQLAHEILEHHRDAGKRRSPVNRRRLGPGPFVAAVDDRVEFGIELVDPGESCFHQLRWVQLPRSDRGGLGGGIEVEHI